MCMGAYICICTYVYGCKYTGICLCIHASVCLCAHVSASTCVCVCVWGALALRNPTAILVSDSTDVRRYVCIHIIYT